jgi:hypothetical protein
MIDKESLLELTRSEARRLTRRLDKKQARASRSQYLGTVTTYDAEQGFATVSLPQGGTANVSSITNSLLNNQIAVSLPRLSTEGFADAKPV